MFFLLLDWRLKHILHISEGLFLRLGEKINRITYAEKDIFRLPSNFGLKQYFTISRTINFRALLLREI